MDAFNPLPSVASVGGSTEFLTSHPLTQWHFRPEEGPGVGYVEGQAGRVATLIDLQAPVSSVVAPDAASEPFLEPAQVAGKTTVRFDGAQGLQSPLLPDIALPVTYFLVMQKTANDNFGSFLLNATGSLNTVVHAVRSGSTFPYGADAAGVGANSVTHQHRNQLNETIIISVECVLDEVADTLDTRLRIAGGGRGFEDVSVQRTGFTGTISIQRITMGMASNGSATQRANFRVCEAWAGAGGLLSDSDWQTFWDWLILDWQINP